MGCSNIKIFFYFIAFFLLTSNYWLTKYGIPTLHDVISICLTHPKTLFTFQRQKVIIDFFLCALIYPTSFTFILVLFETWFSKNKHSNQYLRFTLHYLPVFLILFSGLHVWLQSHWVEWLIDAVLICFIVFNWPLLIKQCTKTAAYFFGLILIGFVGWTYHYVGMSNVNQLISTVVFGFSGLLSANQYFTLSLIKFLFIYPLVLTILMLLIEKKFRYLSALMPSLLILGGLSGLSVQYDIPNFIKTLHANQKPNQTDYFHKHFTDPTSITFQTKNTPKSLILIYVESLESTYQNSQLFGHNRLAALTELKPSHLAFQKFEQTSGADWTMAGIVSSQCGFPLKLITLFGRNNIGSNINQFLPGAVCLSDVLANLGYHNVFLNGSSLEFAGINRFLSTHHYQETFGTDEWLKHGYQTSDMIGWGLPDDLLFQQAKIKLAHLIHAEQPFNLTLLTIDTHGFDGQLNKTCAANGGKSFEDIVECSANQVANFINYVDNKGWLDKVTIVVMGDHLAMKNAAYAKLTAGQPRYIFNLIVSKDALHKNRDTIFHVDLFPTILSALGITWPGGEKLALGYSALTPETQPLSASERLNTLEQITASESAAYNQLWLKPQKSNE